MELQVLSQLPQTAGLVLRPYDIDGVATIGVFGDEPFELRFGNVTGSKLEIIISVDGRNVLTGQQASLTDRNRFVVQPYGNTTLAAWPETTRGGARFVFGQLEDSVAAHTPGDLSAVGYISVAVFTEAEPVSAVGILRGDRYLGPDDEVVMFGGAMRGMSKSAVGAGERIDQQIGAAVGLRVPRFSHTVQLHHVWWDDLVARLQQLGVQPSASRPSGFFPEPRPLANLGSTPRPDGFAQTTSPPAGHLPGYSRFM